MAGAALGPKRPDGDQAASGPTLYEAAIRALADHGQDHRGLAPSLPKPHEPDQGNPSDGARKTTGWSAPPVHAQPKPPLARSWSRTIPGDTRPKLASRTVATPARLVAGAAGPPSRCYDADIVILALDRTEDTLAAIASARAQTGLSAHVFVLDQGSAPDGLTHLARVVANDASTTLLTTGTNLGVAGGRNLISNLGHGRAIVALDNDAVFATTDTVARLVAALDAEPRLAAIGCRIVSHADGRDDPSSWGYAATLRPCAAESFDAVTYVGAGHVIRRTAWEQAGGYDPKLFFCWEEFDFCLRAIALGWRVRYRGDIVVRHKVAPEQRVAWNTARWFYFVRNRLYIERKLGRGWLALAPRACGYLLKGSLHGMPRQTLQAFHAVRAMAPRRTAHQMPPSGLSYLMRNDRAHRGSLPRRFLREVLGAISPKPDAASATE